MFCFWHYKHHKKRLKSDLVEGINWLTSGKWLSSLVQASKLRKQYPTEKGTKETYLPCFFNNDNVLRANSQKHLGINFDNRLSFDEHLKIIINKVNKTISLPRKLNKDLRRSYQVTIYKAFVRLYLD